MSSPMHVCGYSMGKCWRSASYTRQVHFPGLLTGRIVFLTAKQRVSLRFERQRFYNPHHHHPEMPRTLQSLDRRVGHGEDYGRMLYDQVYVSSIGTSDPGSIGDTFEREDLLRSVE
jgi:hypothetical protein